MSEFLRTTRVGKSLVAVVVLGVLFALRGSALRALERNDSLQHCSDGPAGSRYLDFQTFKALKALAPELVEVRFAGLAEAGYELWEQGQMRVPVDGNFLREDLNQDGKVDCTILLEGRRGDPFAPYILIAHPTKRGWSRVLLQRLDEPGSMRWDGKKQAIEIDPGRRTRVTSPATLRWESGQVVGETYGYAIDIKSLAYLRWDSEAGRFEYVDSVAAPFRPWNVKANLGSYAWDYRPDEFVGVHIKFTPVGPLSGARPGLLLLPPNYAPNLELFKGFRRPGIVYRSDDAGAFRTLILPAKQIQNAVLAISNLKDLDAVVRRTGREPLSISVAIIDAYTDKGPSFAEVLLTSKEARSLLSAIARRIGTEHPSAARVVEDYLKAF